MRPIPRKRMQKRPHMTIYPLEFHRRTEQRWARRAQLSRASETLDVECPCSVPPGPPLLSRNASADAGGGNARPLRASTTWEPADRANSNSG
jgi:hypothetical protein